MMLWALDIFLANQTPLAGKQEIASVSCIVRIVLRPNSIE